MSRDIFAERAAKATEEDDRLRFLLLSAMLPGWESWLRRRVINRGADPNVLMSAIVMALGDMMAESMQNLSTNLGLSPQDCTDAVLAAFDEHVRKNMREGPVSEHPVVGLAS